MRSLLILAIFALFFASCHNEVPELREQYKSCQYVDNKGDEQCKVIYTISENDCRNVGGTIFCDDKCSEICPSPK